MLQIKTNKTLRFWFAVIKLLIAALAFLFIYQQVIRRENFLNMISEYRSLFQEPNVLFAFAALFFLMIVNWSLEAFKWKLVMSKMEQIPFSRCLAAVFSGLTVSFFTPNRIGEYAGRIFHLRTRNRIRGTLVTILENISQLLITTVIGSISLVFYLNRYVSLHDYLLWTIGVLMFVFSAAVIFLYLEIPVVDKSILKIPRLQKASFYLGVLSEYKKKELLVLLALALLRYTVFTYQFFILLGVFGIHASYPEAMLLICMTFFVMTLIPSFALTEIGVRGAVATYFFLRITPDSLAVLNATVSLWLINLVIPALVGIIFIFQFRFNPEK